MIEAVSFNRTHRWKTKADANGHFSVTQHRGDKTLQLSSADGTHAASVLVRQDSSEQRFVVVPVGHARFTLVDDNGGPIAKQKVVLRATLHSVRRNSAMTRNVGTKITDAKGRVSFQNLVPDTMHRLSLADGPAEVRRRGLTSFRIQPGEDYEEVVTAR